MGQIGSRSTGIDLAFHASYAFSTRSEHGNVETQRGLK